MLDGATTAQEESGERERPLYSGTAMETEDKEERRLDDGENPSSSTNWNPDRASFLLAALVVSPFVSYTVRKQGWVIATIYSLSHGASIPLALRTQDGGPFLRWGLGMVVTIALSASKTASLMSSNFADVSVAEKGLYYAFTALWECSNAVYVFGGRSTLERDGVISYERAALAVLCPTRLRFLDSIGPTTTTTSGRWTRWATHSLHLVGYGVAGLALEYGLRRSLGDFLEHQPILEAEAIVMLVSCLVHVWNLPPHLFQCALNARGCPVRVVYPYGSVYCSTSSRDFWSRWSRPGSSLVRHMFYYPTGGSERAWLSVPLMFFLNASSHYSVSESIVGDKNETGWNLVFGTLGLAATAEVLGNRCLVVSAGTTTTAPDESVVSAEDAPAWWRITRFVVAAVSLRFAAYTLVHRCLNSSLSDMVGS